MIYNFMKKFIINITTFIIVLFLFQSPVFANGILDVIWDGVPDGDPIFVVNNMLPGDTAEKTVDVINSSTIPRFISIKGVKVGPSAQNDPKIEGILDFTISQGTNVLYGSGSPTGPKKLVDFFVDSQVLDGIKLSQVTPSSTASYEIKVYFPSSAGNQYQLKSVIFDLIIGYRYDLVINEVYYKVDSSHGSDSPKDRGVSASITGNGYGSTNIINLNILNTCLIVQKNNTNITNNVSVNTNTGGIKSNKNSGKTTVNTGNSFVSINILNLGSVNIGGCGCNNCNNNGQDDEWVEIYNPGNTDVSLKNWSLTDNSGNKTIINANKIIKADGFAVLSKDAATWKYWTENPNATIVELGKEIGDGLDNGGDRLYLKNPQSEPVDAMSWRTDTALWNPSVPQVASGNSLERLLTGYDNDLVSDWESRNPPSPGN